MSSDPLIFKTLTIPREAVVSFRKLARLPIPRSWVRHEFLVDASPEDVDSYLCRLITGSWHLTVSWDPDTGGNAFVVYFEREDDCVLFVLDGNGQGLAKND